MNKKLILLTFLSYIMSNNTFLIAGKKPLQTNQIIETTAQKSKKLIPKEEFLKKINKSFIEDLKEQKITKKEIKKIIYTYVMRDFITEKEASKLINDLKLISIREKIAIKLRKFSSITSETFLKYGGLILSGYSAYNSMPIIKYFIKTRFKIIDDETGKSHFSFPLLKYSFIPLLGATVSTASFLANTAAISANWIG